MADYLNGIILSEILADNPDIPGAFDTNNDNNGDKQDEYIEFQNASSGDIDLDGYQVWSQKNGLLHEFDAGDIIAQGGTVVVVGTFDEIDPDNVGLTNFYQASGENDGAAGNGNSTGGFLEDGEGQKNDTLYLVDPDGNYISFSYGNNASVPATLPTGFPPGGARQGNGEVFQNNAGNSVAFERDPLGEFTTGTPSPGTPGVVCFAAGTMIATDQGPMAVEAIAPDARVLTRDNGYAPLRAVRASHLSSAELRWNPELCPVHIPAGVFGNIKPLVVSPAHRILVTGADVGLINGHSEALVPAHHLVGHANVCRVPVSRPVTYYHLLFDRHEIVHGDGVWSESLFLGDIAEAAIRAAEEWTVADGCALADLSHGCTARTVLKGYEAAALFGERQEMITLVPHAA